MGGNISVIENEVAGADVQCRVAVPKQPRSEGSVSKGRQQQNENEVCDRRKQKARYSTRALRGIVHACLATAYQRARRVRIGRGGKW